jgi:nucleotide-binding universal stress UspA family protein
VTVVVGYRAGNVGLSGLHLATRIARTLHTSLTVATIVPKPWLPNVDPEYEQWVQGLAAASANEAAQHLRDVTEGVDVIYVDRAHRSVSGGLLELIDELEGEMLVLGALPSGGPGQVVIGSTADWLLHASPVPVAISPAEYRSGAGRLTRLTCAYSATSDTVDVVRRCVEFGERLGVPLRVITFAVRGRTMYPPEVGLHAEDAILQAWASQARDILAGLKTDDIVGDEVELQVVTGRSWREALDRADWQEGEIMALGTRPRGDISRVFLGSRSGKIIRGSPVPALVLPG